MIDAVAPRLQWSFYDARKPLASGSIRKKEDDLPTLQQMNENEKNGTINNKSASVKRKNETAGLLDVFVSFPFDVFGFGLRYIKIDLNFI